MTNNTTIPQRFIHYFCLMRFHKPVGILLLLWPALWALWIAGNGKPNGMILSVFIAGVIIMRAAGCIINDIADRHFDGYVTRTKNRPLVTGAISLREAVLLFFILVGIAFLLVLLLNRLTLWLSFAAIFLAVIYPFMKRFTYLPQVVLGAAFAWSVPMAFAAQTDRVSPIAWLIYIIAILWPIIYDTFYAMTDKEDDIKIGIKSTAILFGHADRIILMLLQILMWLLLFLLGICLHMNIFYYLGCLIAGGFAIYQQYLIKNRDPQKCFQAFLNNQWVGLVIFLGIFLNYSLQSLVV